MISTLLLMRLAIGAMFVVSGMPKIMTPRKTARDVENYHVLPRTVAVAYGYVLGPLELVAALSLLSGNGARLGIVIVLALLASFMTAVGIAMYRKQNLTCTCFGLLYRERVGWATQGRDAVLAGMALAVAIGPGVPSMGEMVTSGSALGIAGAVVTVVVLAVALGLGWVAAKGWPQWVVRARQEAAAPVSGVRS